MSFGFYMTPLQRQMMNSGGVGPPPPRDGWRRTLVVRDAGGIDCEGAKYPLLALRGMDVNLWVTHAELGSFHLVAGGRVTRVGQILSARFHRGEELTLTATGEDARGALDLIERMLEVPAWERRGMYRQHYREGAAW